MANRINLDEAIALFRAGFSVGKIAKHFQVTRQSVYQRLEQAGVYFRRSSQSPAWSEADWKAAREIADRTAKERLRLEAVRSAAMSEVAHAVASGRLIPQPCEVCGESPQQANGSPGVHAHHDDYSKPLQVRWLCLKDSRAWHLSNTPKYE